MSKKVEKTPIAVYVGGYGVNIKILDIFYGINDKIQFLLDGKKVFTRVIKYDTEEECEPYFSLYGERYYLNLFQSLTCGMWG